MKKLIIATASAGVLSLGLGACGSSTDSVTRTSPVASVTTTSTHSAPSPTTSKTSVSATTKSHKPVSGTFSPKGYTHTPKPTSAVTQRSTALPTRVPAPTKTKRVSRSEVRRAISVKPVTTQDVQRAIPTKTAVKSVAPKTYAPKPIQTKTVAPVQKKQIVTPKPTVNTVKPKVSNNSRWDAIAACESGGNSRIVSSNGLYGGLYQIDRASTWGAYGGKAYASSPEAATAAQQLEIAKKIQASQGWNAWPVCSHH